MKIIKRQILFSLKVSCSVFTLVYWMKTNKTLILTGKWSWNLEKKPSQFSNKLEVSREMNDNTVLQSCT